MNSAVVIPKWKKWRLLHRKQMKCEQCKRIFNYPANCKNRKYCSIKCQHLSLIGRKLKKEHKNKISNGVKNSSKYYQGLSKRPKIINSGCFKKGELLGEKHPMWNGGKTKHDGYIYILKRNHPFANQRGYVREHRLILEKILGRYLNKEEVCHHINGIKDDNKLENLMLFKSQSDHRRIHRKYGGRN